PRRHNHISTSATLAPTTSTILLLVTNTQPPVPAMAAKQAAILGMILFCGTLSTVAATSEDAKAISVAERTVFVDGGNTDSFSVTDVFLYIGTLTLASLTALIILGLIYDKNDTGAATSYETTGYTGYGEQAYSVARSLYDGYKKYSDKEPTM
ncbi:unnamed protein product, partial [Meganyctiphanes norvegica]